MANGLWLTKKADEANVLPPKGRLQQLAVNHQPFSINHSG
jgi:hypothetical protein